MRHLEQQGRIFAQKGRYMAKANTVLDKRTAAELDAEIANMTDQEQQELSRIGNRIINKLDTPDGAAKRKAYQAEYMFKYRARIALAKQRGLLNRDE